MRLLAACLLSLTLGACAVNSPPPTTLVVPEGSTVVCIPGTNAPCR